ncbi:MAG: aminopeptidase P N-terminal domain-containing protein [Planctomycetota bacterium]
MFRALSLLLLAGASLGHPLAKPDRDAADRRRDEIRRRIEKDYALVFAQPFTDILHPRQEGNYLYLTGVREPGGILLLGPGVETLYLPRLRAEAAQFYGHEFHPDEATAQRLALQTGALPSKVSDIVSVVAAPLPDKARLRIPRYGGQDQATVRERRRKFVEQLAKVRPDVTVSDLGPTLRAMRVIKDELEIAHLRRAVAITEAAFRAALPRIAPGGHEADVESALMAMIRRAGARPSFPFVVGSGRNAAIPHYFANDSPLAAGGVLVVDAGAAHHRYAADITRTFPVSGRFSAEQRRIYNAVLAAQLAGIAAVKPGASFRDVHKAARNKLKEHGLDRYFIHGTSHHVGLDAHDAGPTKRLEPGMTLTVEPGVYILEKKLGIRIEDMVLVTSSGCEVLSRGLPKTADAIEKLLSR